MSLIVSIRLFGVKIGISLRDQNCTYLVALYISCTYLHNATKTGHYLEAAERRKAHLIQNKALMTMTESWRGFNQ